MTDFRSVFLPYCIEKLDDGSWVVLNRQYKPIGFNTDEFINYEDYPVSARLEIKSTHLKKISYNSDYFGKVYLYNDGCHPFGSKKNMDSYLEKLRVLAKLRITQEIDG